MFTLALSNASRVLAAVVFLGSSFAVGAAAAADVTTYANETLFDQAVPSLTTYSFPAGSGDGSFEARPYIVGPLGFSTYQHFTHPYLQSDGVYGAGVNYLAMIGIPGVNAAIQTQVDGVYALGFNLGTFDGPDTITVSINFGQSVGTFTTDGGVGSSSFFGIVSTDAIQQISFTAGAGEEIDFVNFKTNTISAVPEPASMVLTLAGLGVVGLVIRRRQTVHATSVSAPATGSTI